MTQPTNKRLVTEAAQAVAIAVETTRATTAEGANTTAISNEVSRATAAEATKVPSTRTVAGKALSADVALVKGDVGLGNVDNTADASKPVSTAQAAALAAKADLVGGLIPSSQIPSLALTTSVVVASQAAMLALTTTQVQPGDLAIRTDGAGTFILNAVDPSQIGNWTRLNAPTDVVTSVAGQTGTVVLAKGDVGLGNVDNVADANKPVSTAQAAADAAVLAATAQLTGAQTIAGVKTFSSSPVVPTPAAADNSTKAASTAYVDAGDALKASKAITRVGGMSTGGTDAFFSFPNAATYAVRVPVSVAKTVTRGRFWYDTNRDSAPGTATGTLAITSVYLGVEDPANEGQYLTTPVLISAAPGNAAYNSRCYTPYVDFAANGWNIPGLSLLMTFVLTNSSGSAQVSGNSNGSNGWVSATVASAGSLALTSPFRAPCQVRVGLDYEYIDDGSQIGLFIGPSFVDSGGQSSGAAGNRGQDSGWPQRWARDTGNHAVCYSMSSALAARWGTASDPIYAKFPNVKPDFIFLSCVCGNDIAQGATLAAAQASFRAVVAACKTNYPGVPIHTSTDMPYGPGFVSGPNAAAELIRQQFNAWLGTLGPNVVASVTDFDGPLIDLVDSVSAFTSVTFTDTGDTVTITGHGAYPNDLFIPDAITSTTGLTAGQAYFVRTVIDANTFTLSATPNGTLLALTTNGSTSRAVIQKAPATWKQPLKNVQGGQDLSHPGAYGAMVIAMLLAARFTGRIPS